MVAHCSTAPSLGCFAAYTGTQNQEFTGSVSLSKNFLTWGQLEYQSIRAHTFPSYGHLALVVYVDDFQLSGDSNFHDAFWSELSKRIMIEDVGELGRFLGRHHITVSRDGHEQLAFDMRAHEGIRQRHDPRLCQHDQHQDV